MYKPPSIFKAPSTKAKATDFRQRLTNQIPTQQQPVAGVTPQQTPQQTVYRNDYYNIAKAPQKGSEEYTKLEQDAAQEYQDRIKSLDQRMKQVQALRNTDMDSIRRNTNMAQENLNDQMFREYLSSRERMANRGVSNSGLMADAQIRLNANKQDRLAELYNQTQDNLAEVNRLYAPQQTELLNERDNVRQSKIFQEMYDKTMNNRAREAGMLAPLMQNEFTREERLGGQDFSKDMQEDTQQFTTDERLGGQKFITDERLGGQKFITDERLGSETFQKGMQDDSQEFTAGEGVKQRGHETSLQEGQQTWQSGENTAQRGHETSLQEGRQIWESGENASQRAWEGTQRQADRVLETTLTNAKFSQETAERLGSQNFQKEMAAINNKYNTAFAKISSSVKAKAKKPASSSDSQEVKNARQSMIYRDNIAQKHTTKMAQIAKALDNPKLTKKQIDALVLDYKTEEIKQKNANDLALAYAEGDAKKINDNLWEYNNAAMKSGQKPKKSAPAKKTPVQKPVQKPSYNFPLPTTSK